MIAAMRGQYLVGATAWLIVGALLGFLPFNFPKASIFLGDAGSHLIGYLLAVLGILPHFYTPHHPTALAVLTPLVVLGRAARRSGVGGRAALAPGQTVLYRGQQPSVASIGAARLGQAAGCRVYLAAGAGGGGVWAVALQ